MVPVGALPAALEASQAHLTRVIEEAAASISAEPFAPARDKRSAAVAAAAAMALECAPTTRSVLPPSPPRVRAKKHKSTIAEGGGRQVERALRRGAVGLSVRLSRRVRAVLGQARHPPLDAEPAEVREPGLRARAAARRPVRGHRLRGERGHRGSEKGTVRALEHQAMYTVHGCVAVA